MQKLATALLIVAYCTTPVQAEKRHTFRDSMSIGKGIDGVTGELRGVCVEVPPVVAGSGGQDLLMRINKVESSQQLSDLLGLEVEASYAGFASGKLNYLSDKQVSRFSEYVMVSISVDNSHQLPDLAKVRLTEDARLLLEAGNAERFAGMCGTDFLYSISTGGQFFALYEFSSETSSESVELEVELEGSYGVYSASGQFNQALNRLSSHEATSISVYRSGDLATPVPDEPAAFIEYAINFPAAIADPARAVSYSMVSYPYTVLPLPPIPTAAFDSRRFNGEIETLNVRNNIYRDAITDLKYVVERPGQFEDFDRDTLLAAMETFRAGQRAIERRIRSCLVRDEAVCLAPASEEIVTLNADLILPRRKDTMSPIEKMKVQCDTSSPSKARIVRLEYVDDHVVLLLRHTAAQYRPRFTGFETDGSWYWRRWSAQGTAVDVLQPGCTLYRDFNPVSGRVCYAVLGDRTLGQTRINLTDDSVDLQCINLP